MIHGLECSLVAGHDGLCIRPDGTVILRKREVIHVEREVMDDGTRYGFAFCDEADAWNRGRIGLHDVSFEEWKKNPEQIQRATCPECLLRIFMLGDHASIALAKMGMKVEARNVGEES